MNSSCIPCLFVDLCSPSVMYVFICNRDRVVSQVKGHVLSKQLKSLAVDSATIFLFLAASFLFLLHFMLISYFILMIFRLISNLLFAAAFWCWPSYFSQFPKGLLCSNWKPRRSLATWGLYHFLGWKISLSNARNWKRAVAKHWQMMDQKTALRG